MSKKDDICRCIADEVANINIENLKENGTNPKNSSYSKQPVKPRIKNRSLY